MSNEFLRGCANIRLAPMADEPDDPLAAAAVPPATRVAAAVAAKWRGLARSPRRDDDEGPSGCGRSTIHVMCYALGVGPLTAEASLVQMAFFMACVDRIRGCAAADNRRLEAVDGERRLLAAAFPRIEVFARFYDPMAENCGVTSHVLSSLSSAPSPLAPASAVAADGEHPDSPPSAAPPPQPPVCDDRRGVSWMQASECNFGWLTSLDAAVAGARGADVVFAYMPYCPRAMYHNVIAATMRRRGDGGAPLVDGSVLTDRLVLVGNDLREYAETPTMTSRADVIDRLSSFFRRADGSSSDADGSSTARREWDAVWASLEPLDGAAAAGDNTSAAVTLPAAAASPKGRWKPLFSALPFVRCDSLFSDLHSSRRGGVDAPTPLSSRLRVEPHVTRNALGNVTLSTFEDDPVIQGPHGRRAAAAASCGAKIGGPSLLAWWLTRDCLRHGGRWPKVIDPKHQAGGASGDLR